MSEENKNAENPKPNPPPKPSPAPAPEKRRWLEVIIILVMLIVVGGLLYLFLHRRPKPAAPTPPVRVSTTNAIKGDIGIYVGALGSVTPVATVALSSQVTGRLTTVNYQEGQLVNSNDLLLQIDERPFQAQLVAAEGQLERDQALLEEARMDLKRYDAAAAQNAIPKQQYEDELALTHQYEGTVKNDQGLLDNAKVQLSYCHIAAPVSGRVGLRLVDPGNLVQSSSTNALVVVTQLQPITIIFSVTEDYLPQIQHQLAIGNHMTVEAYDRAQQIKTGSGSVLALDNQIDNTTGTIRLRSLFTNQDNALFPNQFVNVQLLIDTLRDKTLIPASAVQRNAQTAFVYVVKSDQTVEMRTIKTDATDGNVTAVEGLQPGESIVTDNFNRLADGAKISERKPGEGGEGKPGGAGRTNSAAGDQKSGAGKHKRGDTNQPHP